ncbi:hypothetical protein P7K49_037896, partial [Saguinus oedipus]
AQAWRLKACGESGKLAGVAESLAPSQWRLLKFPSLQAFWLWTYQIASTIDKALFPENIVTSHPG